MTPITLREFQEEAVSALTASALDTIGKIRRAVADRRRIARRIGCYLLEAPTGSGKTVMLAATAERISRAAPVVWFWFAPFAGLVGQTSAALRAVAPGLRVRNPTVDRADTGTRPGDAFVATWASVAARNAATRRMRSDDDIAPALDTLIRRLRAAGFQIGAIVDEAHHSFRPGTEAFRFFDLSLDPDILLCATATPDDGDVEILRRALDVTRFQRIAVSRNRVVAERLNKPMVRAVQFVAYGTARDLIDLNEVALRKAVEHHRALKAGLKDNGIPVVPLLLVQAASAEWAPARVRDFLRNALGFAEGAVATHTADEPDPDLQALANDPDVEVLVFKMAVATGFDAPRAFSLCALRPVVDANFGLQVVGRIMRVHPLLQMRPNLPALLDTGWVFLGAPEGQAGLLAAAGRIKAIRDAMELATDNVMVYEAGVSGEGRISVVGGDGQAIFVLEPPPGRESWVPPTPGPPPSEAQSQPYRIPDSLFGRLAEQSAPAPAPPPSGASSSSSTGATHAVHRYPKRSGVAAPKCLRTEKLPPGNNDLLDALVRAVRFGDAQISEARRSRVEVERTEREIFDNNHQRACRPTARFRNSSCKHLDRPFGTGAAAIGDVRRGHSERGAGGSRGARASACAECGSCSLSDVAQGCASPGDPGLCGGY
ncbi:MAG: DEAD/DEAH box helicase family protein [Alphaproteobacteria bacterium]|nr:DEAD/DEAH box helicase family protein [Alphaproteobacteria bacterium]